MDRVTAGSKGSYSANNHNTPSTSDINVDDITKDSTLIIAIAIAIAIDAPNVAIAGSVADFGDTTAIASITINVA